METELFLVLQCSLCSWRCVLAECKSWWSRSEPDWCISFGPLWFRLESCHGLAGNVSHMEGWTDAICVHLQVCP